MEQILGVTVSTERRMEKGDPRVRLHAAMVCRVSRAFQISADALLLLDLEKHKE